MQTIGNLAKWGGSVALRIPKNVLIELGISENEEVSLRTNEKKELIIKAVHKHRKLSERFKDWKDVCSSELVDFGKPEGKEEW